MKIFDKLRKNIVAGIAFGAFFSILSCGENAPIKIASFNIRNFGKSKCTGEKHKETRDILGKIIRQYDLIAVQEISWIEQPPLEECLDDLITLSGTPYTYDLSPRTGTGQAEEQYAFIYNPKTIRLKNKNCLENCLYPDPQGNFNRKPYLAWFSAGEFDFVLITAHTTTGPTLSQEIAHLGDAFDWAEKKFPQEKDFMLLGDLNTDHLNLNEKYFLVIKDGEDTTVKTTTDYANDRIIFKKKYTSEDYTGNHGVFRFDEFFDLTEEAENVSDHYPVWAEFYTDRDND